MSSEVETSRDETNRSRRRILRLRFAPLRMKMTLYAQIVSALVCVSAALAQESRIATPEQSPSPLISPVESVTASPTPAQMPSAVPTRSVRISFVPPQVEGTINLGIYDKSGKLVRVLRQQAQLNEFAIGADGLVTQWDGKNDDDEDLPSGKYRARGYVVGPLKIEDLGETSASAMENIPSRNVKVRLVRNPLGNDKRPVLEIGVAFDSDGSYLEASDELPLFTISETPNLTRAWIAKTAENAVNVWQDDGTKVHRFRISNLDKMMAFDCGEFELK